MQPYFLRLAHFENPECILVYLGYLIDTIGSVFIIFPLVSHAIDTLRQPNAV